MTTWPNGAPGGGAGDVVILTVKVDEVVRPALSFNPTLHVNDPATVGVPEMVPLGDRLRPVGSAPLRRDQV
jgi:hypothetical protein